MKSSWDVSRSAVFAVVGLVGFAVVALLSWTGSARADVIEPPAGAKSEIVGARSLFSKTWVLRDGREVTRVSNDPVHFRDGHGKLKNLNLDVRESRGRFSANVGEARVVLPDEDSTGVEVTDAGRRIRLAFEGDSTAPKVEGTSIAFDDVAPGVDRNLTVLANGVKEDIILEDASAPRQLEYSLTLGDGLVPKIQNDGSVAIFEGDEVVYSIPTVLVYEQGSSVAKPVKGAYSLAKDSADTWRLGVDVDIQWMDAEERRWPIVVDPSIVIDRMAGITSDYCLAVGTSGGCGPMTTDLNVGWGQGVNFLGALVYSSMVFRDFTLPTTLNNRVITDARLGMYQKAAWGRPGTAGSAPTYPGSSGTSYPLPGVSQQTLELSPVTNPANMNWPLREAPIDRKVVASGSAVEFNVAAEVRAWIANRLNPADGWAQRGIGVRTAGTPLGNKDANGCRIDLNTAACQGQYSQIAGLADPDTAKRPYLDIYSAPPAQVGSYIESPREGSLTSRFVELRANASSPNVTTATFQYVAGDDRDWRDVPAGALKKLSDGGSVSGSAVPIGLVDGGANDALVWDLQATPGGEVDGPVHLRALLDTSGGAPGGGVTGEVNFRLDRRNPAAASSEVVGPADVNLVSGDASVAETDASIPAFLTDLTMTRTYHSRGVSPRNEQMFGPGWIAGFDVGDDSTSEFKSIYSFSEVKVGAQVEDWMMDELAAQTDGYDGDDFEFEPPSEIPRFEVKYAVLELNDGSKITYILKGGEWVPDDEFALYDLALSGGVFTVTDLDDGETEFSPQSTGSPLYIPTRYREAGDSSGVVYEYTVSGSRQRLLRVVAPRPGSTASCSTPATWPDNCRALELGWTVVLANGTLALRVGTLKLRAWDPSGQTTGSSHTIAKYEYDSAGRLIKVTDPRDATGLPTEYSYDSAGRMTSYKLAGLKPWTFEYDTVSGDDGDGRVKSITREAPDGTDATTSFVYDVPLSGTGAPHDMSPGELADWGQSQLPRTATAIFPPEEVPSGSGLPSSWDKAAVYYLSTDGDILNVADPLGGISTTEYDLLGNITRELSAENRERALAAGTGSVAKSYKLDTQYEYAANGIDLITTLSPETEIRQPGGTTVTARRRVSMSYDAGKPSGFLGDQHLLTEVREGALRSSDNVVIDEETTTYAYSKGASNRGWVLGKPLTVTEGAGGEQQVTEYVYSSTYPLLEKKIRPRSNGSDTQTSVYYYHGIGWGVLACFDTGLAKAGAMSGALCGTTPAAQPGGSTKPVMGRFYFYSMLWDVIKERNSSTNGASSTTQTRTTDITRDDLGREVVRSVESSVGSAIPRVITIYDQTTGLSDLSITVRSLNDASLNDVIERQWDDNGRLTAYIDANDNTTEYEYDLSGRVSEVTDPLGSREISYDDAGSISSIDDSRMPGPIEAERNADGALVAEDFPGDVRMERQIDATGTPVSQDWKWTSGCSSACEIANSETELDAQGRVVRLESDQSVGEYTYDSIGRLKRTDDKRGGVCERVDYGYDKSSNRTSMSRTVSAPAGNCGTGTTTNRTNTFDIADHITNSGYVYDDLGRTTSIPAADSPNGQATTMAYAVDDRATSIQAGSLRQDLKYDPMRRILEDTTVNTGLASTVSETMYGGDGQEASGRTGSWGSERYIPDADGAQVAMSDGTNASLYISNLRGDIVATMGVGASATTSRVEYTPFGEVAGSSGTLDPNGVQPGFVGAQGAQSIGNVGGYVHMGVRVYNPESGRFLQPDAITDGSANAYDYSNQDPMNQVDVNGYCPSRVHEGPTTGTPSTGASSFATVHFCQKWVKNVWKKIRRGKIGAKKITDIACSALSRKTGFSKDSFCDKVYGAVQPNYRRIFRDAARNNQCVTVRLNWYVYDPSSIFLGPKTTFTSAEMNRSTHSNYCLRQ